MTVTLRLAHPLDEGSALQLGMVPRDYALNEIIDVSGEAAEVLLYRGIATTDLTGAAAGVPPLNPSLIAAVQAWLAANPPTAAPATETTRGTIKLGGHIAGTADNPTVPELLDKANKDDSRLSDARTPLPHSDSHAYGGTDVITPQDIGAVSTEFVGQPNGVAALDPLGHVVRGQLPIDVQDIGAKVDTEDPRLSDARTPILHHTTHEVDGVDPISPERIGALTQTRADGRYLRSVNGLTPDAQGNVSFSLAPGTVMSIIYGGGWPPRTAVSTDPNAVILWIGPALTPPSVGGTGMGSNDLFIGR